MNAPVTLAVAVATPAHSALAEPLSYRHAQALPPGQLLRVPLGKREVLGVVWAAPASAHGTAPVDDTPEPAAASPALREVIEVWPDLPPLSQPWRDLVSFAARYYQRSVGEMALAALPPAMRSLTAEQLARRLAKLQPKAKANKRGKAQTADAQTDPHADAPDDAPAKAADLRDHAPATGAPIAETPPPLTAQQSAALAAIAAQPGIYLLHGNTGSGKTEVYMQAAAQALAANAQAQVLVMVPEINLTPQLEARFQARFGTAAVVAMHSGLTPAQRLQGWLKAHLGQARIVLGTRMAVFASLPQLALIVVDEEHDPSYKQQEGARYSARDLAVWRGHHEGLRVVLGSATPSLESWWASRPATADDAGGRYQRLAMPDRVAGPSAGPPPSGASPQHRDLGQQTAHSEAALGRPPGPSEGPRPNGASPQPQDLGQRTAHSEAALGHPPGPSEGPPPNGASPQHRDLGQRTAHREAALGHPPGPSEGPLPSGASPQHRDLGQRTTRSEAAWGPLVRRVDMNHQPRGAVLAPPLLDAIATRVARGEQCMLLLNRRGYAPVLSCGECGWKSACPHCSVYRVFHKEDRSLRCHHCGLASPVPHACPDCGNPDIQGLGRGTQQLQEQVQGLLSDIHRADGTALRIARIDADTTRHKGALEQQLDEVHAGEVDVLIGTQMIAKGHDFRRVSLVAAVQPDAALFASDFRAPERLFALLMQAAGRAGRDASLASQAEMWVQTQQPAHPLYAALKTLDYAAFAASQLDERQMAGLPPFAHQALVRADARSQEAAQAFLQDVSEAVRQAAYTDPAWAALLAEVTLYPPVPLTVQRVANVERAQLLLESPSRAALQRFMRAWQPTLHAMRQTPAHKGLIRWLFDVDPLGI